jgi:ribosomal protein S18 acetylase RimI-like enzyme
MRGAGASRIVIGTAHPEAPMTTTPPATTPVDPDQVIATLVLAFSADPPTRWVLPRTDRFHAAFPDLVRVTAGPAFSEGTVDQVQDGAGVAVWVPPGTEADVEGYVAFHHRYVDSERLDQVFAWGMQFEEHRPSEPHWYLAMVGVDPHWSGRGLGSELIHRGLERCDRDGLPVYLEASNANNRRLYERHGFEVVGEVRSDDAPVVWPMLRPAQS